MSQRVGLVGLHWLEPVVSTIGLTPVTEADARDAVMAVHSSMQEHGKFPVLVLLSDDLQGLPQKMAQALRVVVLLKPGYRNSDPNPTYPVVDLPTSLSEVLGLLGLDAATDVQLDEDGHPYEPPVAPEPQAVAVAPSPDWGSIPDAPAEQVVTPVPAPQQAPSAGGWTPPVPTSQSSPQQAYRHTGYTPTRAEVPPEPVNPAPTRQVPEPARWAPPTEAPAQEWTPAPQPWTPPVETAPAASQVSAPQRSYPRSQPSAPPSRPQAPADIFGSAPPSEEPVRSSYRRPGLGELVFTLSGKGGVGKSTTSIALSHRASERGLKVILVDGNFGQGDDATFLIPNPQAEIPTVYDFTYKQSLYDALITPPRLNSLRNAKATPLKFGLVCAPNDTEIIQGGVTPRTYADLIHQAREVADLVVVDTQIVEADDPRGMVTQLVVPELRAGAWGIVIADLSKAGIANLMSRIMRFKVDGANPAHLLSMLNRVPLESSYNPRRLQEELERISNYLGTSWHEPQVQELMNRGHMVSGLPVFAYILDQVLYQTNGLPVSAEPYVPNVEEPQPKSPWWKLWG